MNAFGQHAIDAIASNDFKKINEYITQSIDLAIQEQDEFAVYDLAQQFQMRGFIDEAIAICTKGYDVWSEDDWVILLAELYTEHDRLDEAVELLVQIDDQSPLYVNALVGLADIYHIQGLFDVANHKLDLAKQHEPNEPIIDLARAEIYYTTGELNKAIAIYEKYQHSQVLPNEEWAKRMSKMLLAKGQTEQAVALLEALPNDAQDLDTLFELGLSQYQLKNYSRSISYFETLLYQDPDYFSAYYYYAKALLEDGQRDKAIETLEISQQQNPYHVPTYHELYRVYQQMQQHDKIAALLETIQTYVSDDESLLIVQALYAYDIEDDETVIALLKDNVTQENSADPQVYWLLANSYARLEEDDDAKAMYQTALPYYADNQQFLMDYAQFLKEIGDFATRQTILKQMNQ